MDFLSTIKGSLLENFYPKGWDMKKFDKKSRFTTLCERR